MTERSTPGCSPHSPLRIDVCGAPIDPVSMTSAVDLIAGWRDPSHPRVAVGVNANAAFLARSDRTYRRHIWSGDLTYPDGQSMVWACRLLGHPAEERVATTDLIHPLAQAWQAAGGAHIFMLGARPEIVTAAAARLTTLYPGLTVSTRDGYFSPADVPSILAQINSEEPAALLVALGDPAQQAFVHDHLPALRVGAVLTCGGLFDWLAGVNRRAPQWMIRLGLEWLWRMMIEPKRLAKRYLLGNSWFVMRLVRQMVRQRPGR